MAYKAKDLTGKTFGEWTVIHRNGHVRQEAGWLCECSCGELRTLAGSDLSKGKSKSCGHKKTHCRRGHEYTKENTYFAPDGGTECRTCVQLVQRKHTLKRAHWTVEEFDKTLQEQEGKCAICSVVLTFELKAGCTSTTACADHEHQALFPRGILCTNCNHGVGHFKDNPEIMQSAIEYIRKHNASNARKEI
jgi:hypothetical protein